MLGQFTGEEQSDGGVPLDGASPGGGTRASAVARPTAPWSVGAVANAPMFVVYYGCLDFVVDTGLSALPTSHLMGVLTKVTIDQLLWTPFLYLPVFFGAMALLEGRGLAEARAEVKKKGWGLTPTLVANWKFWVPVLCVTFSVVPREMRILFNNVCALAWTAYLSTIQSEMAPTESVVPKPSSSS